MRAWPLALLTLALALAGCSDSSGDEGQDGSADGGMTGSATAAPTPAAPTTHEVVMRNNHFEPADLAVRVGDTVHWTTEDVQAHNVVSDSEAASFRSEDVSVVPGLYASDFSYTFDAAGTVDYLCEYHSGMVGTIVVG